MAFNANSMKEKLKAVGLGYQKLSDEFTAQGLNVSVPTIKAWFKKDMPNTPRPETLRILCEILDKYSAEIGDEFDDISNNQNNTRHEDSINNYIMWYLCHGSGTGTRISRC